jgi:hypothetical protein
MARGEVTGKKPRITIVRSKRSGPPKPKAKAAGDTETAEDSEAAESETSERTEPEIEPSPHAEICVSDIVERPRNRGPPTPPACFSIKTFCAAHHISEAMFFKMREEGFGPREMRVGVRVLITFEAAADWRAERERAAATAAE